MCGSDDRCDRGEREKDEGECREMQVWERDKRFVRER